MSDWQPIDTAPKDGERFLGSYRGEKCWFCEVVGWEAEIVTTSGKVFPATHWQPLPAPPDA